MLSFLNVSNAIHAERHFVGGPDPIAPEDIGAATTQEVMSVIEFPLDSGLFVPSMTTNQQAVDTGVATVVLDSNSATKAALNSTYLPVVSVQKYGAKGDGITDDTAAFQAAIGANRHVYVPASATDYIINGTINMIDYMHLELASGATLRRAGASTEPMIWMRGLGSVLSGAGMKASWVKSGTASPLGLICIGYKGTTDTGTSRDSSYNTVRGLGVQGKQIGGQTVGAPDLAIYLCDLQIAGGGAGASYFNTLSDLFVANANVGLMLQGWANANLISSIQIESCGNDQQLGGAGIKLAATGAMSPLENGFSNIFHDWSNNAVCLFLSGPVINNMFTNLIGEPGGTTGLLVKNDDDGATDNVIMGVDNTVGGASLTASFTAKNAYYRNGKLFGVQSKAKVGVPIVAGAVTIDASAAPNGVGVVLTAPVTSMTVTNPTNGQRLYVSVQQNGAPLAFVWPTGFTFAGGVAPVCSGDWATTSVEMVRDGTRWLEVSRSVNM